MSDSLDEMVSWCNAHPSPEDLVVLGVTSYGAAQPAIISMFKERNITFAPSCSMLDGLTVAAAAKQASLPGGGALLAIFDCWEEHYEPSVACSGFGDKLNGDSSPDSVNSEQAAEYTCYNDSSTKAFPLNRMWSYLGNVTEIGPPADGQLYTHQAIWQETTASVVVGETHGSNLLQDEVRSGLNWLLADRLTGGAWKSPHLGMLEVNNVCDGGNHLRDVLLALP